MKNLYFISSLRKIHFTILIILLISISTFSLSSRVYEGILVRSELNRLENEYQSVGRIISTDPDVLFVCDAIELLQACNFVRYTDGIRVIQGVMDGVYSPDIGGYTPFNNRMFLSGRLVHLEHIPFGELVSVLPPTHTAISYVPFAPLIDFYIFTFEVEYIHASMPEWISLYETIRIGFLDYGDQHYDMFQNIELGKSYFIHAGFTRNFHMIRNFVDINNSRIYPFSYEEDLGVMYFPNITTATDTILWYDHYHLTLLPIDYLGMNFLYPITENEIICYSIISNRVYEDLTVLQHNLRSVFLRPTIDLSTNPKTDGFGNQTLNLLEGRWIDYRDYVEANEVAVIRREFANKRNLQVGDTLDITLRESPTIREFMTPNTHHSFPFWNLGEIVPTELILGWINIPLMSTIYYDGNYYRNWYQFTPNNSSFSYLELSMGYITDRETPFNISRTGNLHNWRDMETKQKNFEIVGIYFDNQIYSSNETKHFNHVFIPDSIVPAHWEQDILFSNFSFTLHSPRYKEQFVLQHQFELYNLGLTLVFNTSGWETFADAVAPIKSGLTISISMFSLLASLMLFISVLIYYMQHRKVYAIQRALGATKTNSKLHLILPILFISGFGVILGGITGYFYHDRHSYAILAGVSERVGDLAADLSRVSITEVTLVISILLITSLCIIGVLSYILDMSSILELLQGKISRNRFASFCKRMMSGSNKKQVPQSSTTYPLNKINDFVFSGFSTERLCIKINFVQRVFKVMWLIKKRLIFYKTRYAAILCISCSFIIILSFIPVLIQRNLDQVDWLYYNTRVEGTVIIDPFAEEMLRRNFPYVRYEALHDTLNLTMNEVPIVYDFFASTYNEFSILAYGVSRDDLMQLVEGFPSTLNGLNKVLSFNQLHKYNEFFDTDIQVSFKEGYCEDIFHDEKLVSALVISEHFAKENDITKGDFLTLFPVNRFGAEEGTIRRIIWGTQEDYKVVGVFRADEIPYSAIIPLADFHRQVRPALRFIQHVPFLVTIHPSFNREIDQIREIINDFLASQTPAFTVLIMDSILRNAVVPLERNIEMMNRLYPVILGLSLVSAMSITFIVLLQSVKEQAIIRVLGMSSLRTVQISYLDILGIVVLGSGVGAFITWILFESINRAGVLIYLFGVVLAISIFNILFTRVKLMGLLQVSE